MTAAATQVAVVFALMQPPPGVAIGVAVGSGPQVCLAVAASNLTAGTVVTLVDPNAPQSTWRATIAGDRLSSCDALSKRDITGPYYRVLLPSRYEGAFVLMMVFVGEVEGNKTSSGSVTFRLNAEYPQVQVRSCTSSEGLHLTAWEGAPLESRRILAPVCLLGLRR